MSVPEKILIRSANWLGDAVMSMPAVQRLHQARPEAEITVLTREKLADLWRIHPDVVDVIAVTPQESMFQIAQRLKWGAFQVGIIFPNSPRSVLELWLGGVRQRIGYSRPWRNFFLTDKVADPPGVRMMHKRSIAEIQRLIASNAAAQPYPPTAHQVHHYLHLVSAAFGAAAEPMPPRLVVPESELARFKTRFKIPAGQPLFGVNPGAEYGPAKRWPSENFVAAAIALQNKTGCHWLVFGGKGDVELTVSITKKIQAASRSPKSVIDLAGQTTLAELCAGLKCCSVLLTNDSGPMHVAVAVETPVVVPFGSTSPELTGPGYGVEMTHQVLRANVPCSPCFQRQCPVDFRCMKSIPVEDVVSAVLNNKCYTT